MLKHECFIGQRVRLSNKDMLPHIAGNREGEIYFIGEKLVNIEFDHLAYVVAIEPEHITPIA